MCLGLCAFSIMHRMIYNSCGTDRSFLRHLSKQIEQQKSFFPFLFFFLLFYFLFSSTRIHVTLTSATSCGLPEWFNKIKTDVSEVI